MKEIKFKVGEKVRIGKKDSLSTSIALIPSCVEHYGIATILEFQCLSSYSKAYIKISCPTLLYGKRTGKRLEFHIWSSDGIKYIRDWLDGEVHYFIEKVKDEKRKCKPKS